MFRPLLALVAMLALSGGGAAPRSGYIDLRAFHPSASLSERVSYVARFRNGYRVWQIVH